MTTPAVNPSPRRLVEQAGRVLFAHAHPDDETLATGALVAHLADAGVDCCLVTATRGEQGEVVPGPLSHLEGTPQLEEHRAGELARALQVLGFTRHAYLGEPPACAAGVEPHRYRDSGMVWVREGLAGPSDATDERSFTHADRGREVADLLALVEAWRPEVLVSYNAGGGYGHPDHVRMHEVAKAAAASAGIPFLEVHHHQLDGVDWFELDEQLPRVAEALRQHATQLTVQEDGEELVHSGGQRERIVTHVGLSTSQD